MGPVINQSSYQDFQTYCAELKEAGKILTGGEVYTEGDLSKGYFCKPTVAVDAVSYTHLDVYKRQAIQIGRGFPIDQKIFSVADEQRYACAILAGIKYLLGDIIIGVKINIRGLVDLTLFRDHIKMINRTGGIYV